MVGAFVMNFVQFLIVAAWLLVLGRVLVSWVDPPGRHGISRSIIGATEPILAPVRRLLPRTGMIDWSAFIVLIALGFLMRVI